MTRPIWLDITRLAERAAFGQLTGIDRVELAYAQTLRRLVPDRLRFVMLHRWQSRFVDLPPGAVLPFLCDLAQAWSVGQRDDRLGYLRGASCRRAALHLLARTAAGLPWAVPRCPPIYLLTSHRHLHRQAALAGALRRSGAAFVPLVHDLIPLTHPEYARPGEAERHARRIETVAALADAVIVNSAATAQILAPHLSLHLSTPCPIHIAPLGVTPAPADVEPGRSGDRPYFLCVGTIEPRKNHLLLLHLWRRLAERLGGQAPRLVIVGARGWENENVLDLL
ncbi:MAG TPA: glycosyltransferase family 1 protein, partial [Rhodopila sp.]|nr:glycosyltransferase family 1 protein [Rhodopila sp.]